MSQRIKIFITLIALPSLIMFPLQGYVYKEWPVFNVAFEWYFSVFQIVLFVAIVFILFKLWKNKTALKEAKLFWTFALLFVIPSVTVLMYLWLYLEDSDDSIEITRKIRF